MVVRTLESVPPDAAHWNSRGMARASGPSVSTAQRTWRAFGLRPHRLETFELSTDPDFVAKVRDVVGLYMAPPERAPALCVDEKSQIQALARPQPAHAAHAPRPTRPAQPRPHPPRHHRPVRGAGRRHRARHRECYPRHRAAEFRRFLSGIEAAVPAGLDVHLMMDNHATHKTRPVRDWLPKRPRWHVHLTPTSAGWINQVERFSAALTDKRIGRGVHRSVADLKAAIAGSIEQHNAAPEPFRWAKSATDILASVERFCLRTAPARA